MKKLLILAILALIFFTGQTPAKDRLEILPLLNSESAAPNRVWVGTFQLVWNDLEDDIVKGPVVFSNGHSQLAEELNKQSFTANMISENSYYKIHGIADKRMKKSIEKSLKKKFNETSNVLENIDWSSNNYLLYAMLKKDFEFVNAFDKLQPAKFGKSNSKTSYFGIDEKSEDLLRANITVLFYNSPKDFALSLATKGNDIVYLYRTDDDKTFDKLYNDMKQKDDGYTGVHSFENEDTFKVPDINFYGEKTFDELSGKHIKGTDFTINEALETVDFKMNNKGVKLKSEAAIIMKMSMPVLEPRNFNFDDTFVLFLQENEKTAPYFALRVNNIEEINKK